MALDWNLDGASALRGAVYTCVGTSVSLTGGLGVAQSAAFIISNPSTSTVIVTPIKVICATTLGGGIVGFAKALLGTASLAPAGAGGGGVTIVSLGRGTGSPVAQIWGSATMLNGTAGPAAANAWVVSDLHGAQGTNASILAADAFGGCRLLPGESGMVFQSVSVAGIPAISWLETPIQ